MPWECSATCGGGIGTRSRICFDPDVCEGPEEERGSCNTQPCPKLQEEDKEKILADIRKHLLSTHQNFQLQKDESVTVPCKGSLKNTIDKLYPNSKATWLQNGDKIYSGYKRKVINENQDLQIKNAMPEDNGFFTCVLHLTAKSLVTVSLSTVTVQNDKPDMLVEVGSPFSLFCNGVIFSRVFPTMLLQKWYHNSTLIREFKDSKLEDENELYFESSDYSDSGIWVCKIVEINSQSRGKAREWVTNVIRVQVINPPPLIMRLLPYVIGISAGLMLIIIFGCLYVKRAKRKFKEKLAKETGKDRKTEVSTHSKESKKGKKSKDGRK
ncbi:hypothetical protein AVEN_227787-1 [Araneus ventricosus]|uniref:Ig-like domain-containing protein n=1 Tax=Araneus ventricosus TaxID=182803 RepID=A0A4Y2GMQ3_ARAVE|nr:hypothetical protein AVEN_227787-1 [Araneus ventricosus]